MRQLVYYPDPILRVKTKKITIVDDQLLKDVADLEEVLASEKEHAAGLAAVQLGMERRFFGLVMGNKRIMKVFVNPEITKVWGEKTRPMLYFDDGKKEPFLEGCLSFPGLFGEVKRYLKIEAKWQELRGRKLVTSTKILEGIEAIAYQHELDHLNGILFIDHIYEEKGELFKWLEKEKIKWSVDKVVELEQIRN